MYMSMVFFAVAILGRIVFLQFITGDDLSQEVKNATIKLKQVEAPRGSVFADNEQKTSLALSVPRYDLFWDATVPSKLAIDTGLLDLVDSLSVLFPSKPAFEWEQSLTQAVESGRRYHLLKKNVSHIDLQKMKKFPILSRGQFRGGFIKVPKTERVMPYKLLAARTIGYSKEGYRVGIEGAYSKYLTGQDGEILMEKMGGNNWRPIPSDLTTEPIPGADVYTSIDVNIQDVAESALLKQMMSQDAIWGCAVLMEVETGYVKAIANLTKDKDKSVFRESFNHAVGTATEPGSTFKLASLMVALDDGKIRITDSIDMTGKYCFYGSCLHDSKWDGYGKGTIQKAFEVSSNVISKIMYDNYSANPQEFIDGLKDIGLHKKLGLDLSGEDTPLIKDANDETFSGISIPWMSIGYEIEQTPLQTLALYNAVANGGVMLRPQFVKEIRQGSDVVEVFEPYVLNEAVCKASTLTDVQKMLEGVVLRGTARNIRARGFSIAGKTGTAKVAKSGAYSNKYQASFVGYFPAEKPKYSCIVVIQGPTKQIYGSQVSGTVFKEIADKVYAMGDDDLDDAEKSLMASMHFPYSKNGAKKELKSVFNKMKIPVDDKANGSSYVVTTTGEKDVLMNNRLMKNELVPNVLGMGLVDALFVLESFGLVVKVQGSGVVKYQSLSPGLELKKGELIVLNLI